MCYAQIGIPDEQTSLAFLGWLIYILLTTSQNTVESLLSCLQVFVGILAHVI